MIAGGGIGVGGGLDVVQDLSARVIDSPIDMILGATLPTKVILTVLAAFSLVSWVLIILEVPRVARRERAGG